jgi:hypothetical protein
MSLLRYRRDAMSTKGRLAGVCREIWHGVVVTLTDVETEEVLF